jgi:hypothetical protein
MFVDDSRSPEDFLDFKNLPISSLTRSWYRFGEAPPDKPYVARQGFVKELERREIHIGGGTSLAVINEFDAKKPEFDSSWYSRNLDGSIFTDNGKSYASLSVPGFRAYLIKQLVDQAKLGVTELHLGESAGKILFEDETLGVVGNDGFKQWIARKYLDKPKTWWTKYLGTLGAAIARGGDISRQTFLTMTKVQQGNFELEWGVSTSWKGLNRKGQPAFLAYKYKRNLESFLNELRTALLKSNLSHVVVDVWGFAEWMVHMDPQPNAYMSTPPDSRWGLKWSTDSNIQFDSIGPKIRSIIQADAETFHATPIVYMFDHPRPFQQEFIKLSDERQAYLTEAFAKLTWKLGGNFIFRSYSQEKDHLGPKTKETISRLCQEAARRNICPSALDDSPKK